MEETVNNPKKPLRSTSNKVKDLYNTYMKNQPESRKSDMQQETDIEQEKIVAEEEPQTAHEVTESKPNAVETNIVIEDVDTGKISDLEKERDELKDQLKRLAAELDNYRRRSLKEKREMVDYANEKLLLDLLPVLDDLSSAIEAGRQNSDYESLLTGFELIYQKTLKLFENAGVKPMDSYIGKPFDVNFHEALMHIPSEIPEDYVVQLVQQGYMIRDKVLRHAKVITSAGEPKE